MSGTCPCPVNGKRQTTRNGNSPLNFLTMSSNSAQSEAGYSQWLRKLGFVVLAALVLRPDVSSGPATLRNIVKTSADAEEEIQSRDDLRDGAVYDGDFSTEPRLYVVNLTRNQYVELRIAKGDLRAVARILGPDGNSVGDFSGWGRLRASFIASQDGTYRISLQSLESNGLARRYELRVRIKAQATRADENVVRATRESSHADSLRHQGEEATTRSAMQGYGTALRSWLAAGRTEEAIETLDSLAKLSLSLGENLDALNYYRKALSLSHRTGNRRSQIIEMNNVGYVCGYLGQANKTLTFALAALKYYSRQPPADVDDRSAEAAARNSAGEAHYSLGNPKKSIELFQTALDLWKAANDRSSIALAHLNLGYAYSDIGNLTSAEDHFTEALSTWHEIGEQRGEGLSLTALGIVYSFRGEKQKALDNHSRAMAILRLAGDHEGEAAALNSIGKIYEDLSEPQTALDSYFRALEIYRTRRHTDFEAVTKYYIGRVFESLGDKEKAAGYYRESLTGARQSGQQRLIGYALTALSALRRAGTDTQALSQIQQALRLYQRIGDRRGQVNTLNLIGRIHDDRGENELALASYRRALPLSRAAADRNAEAQTQFNIARCEAYLGHLSEALSDVKQSISSIESLRIQIVSPELRTSYFASVHKNWELYIDLSMRLYRVHREQQFLVSAFEASESARARSLLEMLAEAGAQIREGVDPELLRQERDLQQRLRATVTYQMRVVAGADTSEADEVAREVRDLTAAIQDLEVRIKEQSPRYVALVQPQPQNLEQIQFDLDRNTLLLEYSLGDERSYLWAVGADSFQAFELPARAKIEDAAADLYKLLTLRQASAVNGAVPLPEEIATADQQYRKAAVVLSSILMGPIAGLLQNKRLVIVPDGGLQQVPFEALADPAQDLSSAAAVDIFQPLMLRHEIVNLPSASILAAIHRPGAQANPDDKLLAVLADPVFDDGDPRIRKTTGAQSTSPVLASSPDNPGATAESVSANPFLNLSRLSGTRREAEAILNLVPPASRLIATDFDASRNTAMNPSLGHFRIVHFATHGLIDLEHPALSGLILSQVDRTGAPQNGLLQLQDVYNLNLSRTQLVVLSACRTGLGKEIKGEGLLGLTRGFMYAGASTVVASLWKVDDEATSEMMERFYRGMLEDGLTPAAALHRAKQEMWQNPRYREPFFWAAFEVQGEYRDPIYVPPQRRSMAKFVVGGLIGLALIGVIYVIIRQRLIRIRQPTQ
jgi:CHAT domain-containing protein/tetratricopeptide (TPR) repeat protein